MATSTTEMKRSAPISSTVEFRTQVVTNKKQGGAKWTVLVAIVLMGAAAGWFIRAGAASHASMPKTRTTVHLDPFVLNLADPEERAYLRVGIDLGIEASGNIKTIEASISVALLRDTIIDVLSRSKTAELLTAQGKAKLKDELVHALQQRAPEMGIREVYFTEFLIQR